MANLRQIRTRIRSVQNTQKITRAMQMVAGAKLRRSQEALFKARPYVDRLEGLTRRFLESSPGLTHPLLTAPTTEGTEGTAPMALIVAATDTGLCGAYNERLLTIARQAVAQMAPVQVVVIGRKGLVGARRNRWPVLASHTDLGGKVTDAFVQALAHSLIGAYQTGAIRGVQVVYTKFLSAMSWKPTVESWLPLAGAAPTEQATEYLYEPAGGAEIAERLLPAYVTAKLRRLLLEASTAEHSARMMAMQAATDNASQMIDTLTLVRNKVRQATITKELSEIVAGAEALNA